WGETRREATDFQEITPLTDLSPCIMGSWEKSNWSILVTALVIGSSWLTVVTPAFAAGRLPMRNVGSEALVVAVSSTLSLETSIAGCICLSGIEDPEVAGSPL